MEEQYIRGINKELILTLKDIKKIIEQNSSGGTDSGIVDSIDNLEQTVNTLMTNISSTLNSLKEELSNSRKYMNPTHIGIVNSGDTTFPNNVVLCNITDSNISVTVTAKDDTTEQTVLLTPGWNPLIVKAIKGATENTLIYGY